MMMASKREFSEACFYYPLGRVTDSTAAVLSFDSFEKDEEEGIECAVSAAKDTTGESYTWPLRKSKHNMMP
jgi:hypothetical protein